MALQRESMIRTALALLDETGLDGLTVRRLAARLGVQNPALYWHFKNKQDLLNGMAEVMLADAFAGLALPEPGADWAAWLEELAQRLRRALLANRDGARVIAGADLTGSELLVAFDRSVRVLTGAGFSPRAALTNTVTIFDYTLGATFEEQTEPPHPLDEATQEPKMLRSVLDPARLPALCAALAQTAEDAAQIRSTGFEEGLHILLAGIRAVKMDELR